jgi:hypothetical protein
MSKDREICDAATKGPWHWWSTGDRDRVEARQFIMDCYDMSDDVEAHGVGIPAKGGTIDESVRVTALTGNGPNSVANAAYIAHFDPPYQAKLLDVVDAARASLKNAAVVCDEDVALAAALAALDGHGGAP